MEDQKKTKAQLVKELAELRQRIAELEAAVAERVRAQGVLRDSEEKWHSLIENTDDTIMIVDKGNIIRYANRTIPPQTPDEVIGKSVYEYVSEEHHNVMRESLKKVFETGKPDSYEVALDMSAISPEIGTLWYRTKVIPIKSGGEVSDVIMIASNITERRRAEEELRKHREHLEELVEERTAALRESEERLDAFMNAAPLRFGIYDSELNLVEINEAGLASLPAGTEKEDLIGKNFTELAPNLKETGRYDLYMDVIRTGKPFYAGDIVPHPKFGDIHLEVRAFKVGDGFGMITTDVTQRVRAEEELRASEERLGSFMESATDSFIILDSELRYARVNEVAEGMLSWLGLTKEDVVGQNVLEVIPQIRETGRYEKYMEVLRTGTPFAVEDLVPHPEFGDIHLNLKVFKMGEDLGMITTDITERKRAEEALRMSVARGRAVLDAIPDLMFQISKEGIFLDYKAAGDEGLAAPPSVFLGKKMHEVMPSEFARQVMNHVEQALQTGDVQRFEYQLPVPIPDGDLHNFEARLVVSGEDQVLTIVRDITERKRAEEALTQRVEELERFHRLTVGRELRMIELKRQINELSEQLGKEPPHDLSLLGG